MRYDSPANPPIYDFGFGAPPVSFGNYNYGYSGSTPQGMTMGGSIYGMDTSYLAAYSVCMQQDAFRSSLSARNSGFFNNSFSLKNSHVDSFVFTPPSTDAGAGTGSGADASDKANGAKPDKYTYIVDSNGCITYKKPDGTTCTGAEFKLQAGEQEFNRSLEASKAVKGKQS